MSNDMKPIQVGLLGIGTVGSGTFEVLRRNQEEIRRRAGRGIEITMVADLDTARAKSVVGEGVKVVALALDNGPELLLWDLAALFAERPCVIVPSFFSVAQFRHCIEQSGASHVLCDPQWHGTLAELGFAQQDVFWVREAEPAAALPAGTAKITYTSGSTGKPKGVCLSVEALLRVARELEVASRPSEPQRYLAVLPLGVLLENLGAYAALMAGASLLLYPQAQLGMGLILDQLSLMVMWRPKVVCGQINHIAFAQAVGGDDLGCEAAAHAVASFNWGSAARACLGARP